MITHKDDRTEVLYAGTWHINIYHDVTANAREFAAEIIKACDEIDEMLKPKLPTTIGSVVRLGNLDYVLVYFDEYRGARWRRTDVATNESTAYIIASQNWTLRFDAGAE